MYLASQGFNTANRVRIEPPTSRSGIRPSTTMPPRLHCFLRAALVENTIRLHPAEPLSQDYRSIPNFITGDDDFPLQPWLIKPYSMKGRTHAQRVFNFRQARARRVVENIFGILVPTTMQIAALPMPTWTVMCTVGRAREPLRVTRASD